MATNKVPDHILREMRERQLKDVAYMQQFGHARAPISLVFQGRRIVVMGGTVYHCDAKTTQFFTDFLLRIIQLVFGRQWWDEQLAIPFDNRHPAFIWRAK